LRTYIIVMIMLLCLPLSAHAKTILKLETDGKIVANLAESFEELDASNIKIVVPDNMLEVIKVQLESELADSTLEVIEGNSILITAMDAKLVLKRLCEIDVKVADAKTQIAMVEKKPDDPFNNMVAKADITMQAPDGSSSIRVAKVVDEETVKRQFEAIVLEVKQTTFPQVEISLQIISEPLIKIPGLDLHKGKIIKARPFLSYVSKPGVNSANALDMKDFATRNNMVAWYLLEGDRVVVVASCQKNDIVNLMSINRKP